MKTVTVNVTKEDIDAGCGLDAFRCPIAIALNRATGQECCVNEDGFWGFSTEAYAMRRRLPKRVREFPQLFDAGKDISPASFKIRYKPLNRP